MKDDSKKSSPENPIEDYNPTDRDFQRTGNDLDSVSQSEKDNKKITGENYNPTDRDFQRTEGDIDSISQSEKDNKEAEDKKKQRDNTTSPKK